MTSTGPSGRPLLYLDDLAVGQRFGGGAVTLDEDAITAFAGAYDPQPFHLDGEAAAQTLFGRLVACAGLEEAKVFGGNDLGDGETVVDLGDLDVAGRHAGHVVGLLRSEAGGAEPGQFGAIVKRGRVAGLPAADDVQRVVGELLR